VYDGNAEIKTINEIHKVSGSIYFVFAGQVTQPSTVIFDQAATERTVSAI
jgi:hypothetical protein